MASQLDAPPHRTPFPGDGEAKISWPWLKWFQSITAILNGLFPVAAPASAVSKGRPGQWAYDNDYYYVCVDTNVWRRTPIVPW